MRREYTTYTGVHVAARRLLAGRACVSCGIVARPAGPTPEPNEPDRVYRLHAALKLDTPADRLRICGHTGLKFSIDPRDYEPRCPHRHMQQDIGGRPRARVRTTHVGRRAT